MKKLAPLPEWWNAPPDSFSLANQGWTQGSLIMDWLTRHVKAGYLKKAGDRYVFYHGTPKTNKLTVLRAGSQLEMSPERAAHFATHDRRLKISDAIVIQLLLEPQDIYTGVWASLRKELRVSHAAFHPLTFYT